MRCRTDGKGGRVLVRGGRVLTGGRFERIDIEAVAGTARGTLTLAPLGGGLAIDAEGLLVLPGLVDIHGDAFERQIQPRPGVGIDLDLALAETDRQLAANGITTAFHGVTRSWEPGLRDSANARGLLTAIERLRPSLATDTRLHLRHETYNLEGEAELHDWIGAGRVGVLAFNDHLTGTIKVRHRPEKMAKMVERSGLGATDFDALVERVAARSTEVPGSIGRLAAAARAAGIPTMSHDDKTPEERRWYADLGVAIAEFPVTEAVADVAVASGAMTVFGAPNVLRGGSHTGCPDATEMVRRGWCGVLASDYYYPALLQAPFLLAAKLGRDLAQLWPLVSAQPARAAGLDDRGEIAEGRRADLILVEQPTQGHARVVATIANGRLVHLADGSRLAA